MHHGDDEDHRRAVTAAEIAAVSTRAGLGAAQRDELVGVRVPAGMASDDVVEVLVEVERLAVGLARVLRRTRLLDEREAVALHEPRDPR